MRVAVVTFASPEDFGPYAVQMVNLAHALCRFHLVFFFALSHPSGPMPISPLLPSNVTLLGGGRKANQPMFTSSINQLMQKHRIESFISLFDLNMIFVDEPFAPVAIHWFPNHFISLDVHSSHALRAYDVIASLAPSDTKTVQAQLPHKIVHHVPHSVDVRRSPRSRSQLRAVHGVPKEATFVVLVNFANYDTNNRKSIDISVFAFRDFLATHPMAFLYIHATIIKAQEASSGGHVGVPVQAILIESGLPDSSFRLDQKQQPREVIIELTQMADVLLQPSKIEGFGIPVLEAQMLG